MDARADRLEDLTAALVRRRMPVAQWYGVRVFTDTAASYAPLPDDATLDAISSSAWSQAFPRKRPTQLREAFPRKRGCFSARPSGTMEVSLAQATLVTFVLLPADGGHLDTAFDLEPGWLPRHAMSVGYPATSQQLPPTATPAVDGEGWRWGASRVRSGK